MLKPRRYFADQYEGDGEPDLEMYAHYGHVLYAHKATEGVAHIDSRWVERVRTAHSLGLTVLHYHFWDSTPDWSDRQQMDHFWNTTIHHFEPGDCLAIDFERARAGGVFATGRAIMDTWDALERLTAEPKSYYGSSSYLAENTSGRWRRRKRRWEAAYGPMPSRLALGWPWWAWQLSDGVQGPEPHRLAGIPSGDVSMLNLRSAVFLAARTARRRRRAVHKPGKHGRPSIAHHGARR